MAENKSRVLKTVKRIVLITLAAVLAVIISLTVYIMICSASGKVAEVFGTSVLKVVSGSMEPSISEGDYIIVRKTDAGELEEGDIICFYSKDSKIYGMPNTHRIVRILPDGSFVTSGGRVLCVSSTGRSLRQALRNCYRGVDTIKFEGAFYRKDIGSKDAALVKED